MSRSSIISSSSGAGYASSTSLCRIGLLVTLVICCVVAQLPAAAAAAAAASTQQPPPPRVRHSAIHSNPTVPSPDSSPRQESASQSTWNPVPDPAAVVFSPDQCAKFTVLTPALIRMQYDASAQFSQQDLATFMVVNRRLPVPAFTVEVSPQGVLNISTGALELLYDSRMGGSFNASNLQVTVLDNGGASSTWIPSTSPSDGNLLGTLRTLDGSEGPSNTPLDCSLNDDPDAHCSYGMVSRRGFVVVDDTGAPQFSTPQAGTWTWLYSQPQPAAPQSSCAFSPSSRIDCGFGGIYQDECLRRGCCYDNSTAGVANCFYPTQASLDWYMFGYGNRFKAALKDYTRIAGKIPAPPRYLLGVFYSRYWAWNDLEMQDIVQEYIDHRLPLDTLVTDMDWHITMYSESDVGVLDQAGQRIGWTGFTFDEGLFPDYATFLSWCKARGLKNTLNVHPASGMQPWEAKFDAMSQAMGQDPSKGIYVAYNATSLEYNTAWMQLVMAPFEQAGVDIWWLDWQQGEQWIPQARLNPTQMLNYVFASNPTRWNNGDRPALLHRWGGNGNHRMQVGFSGDVVPSWDSLAFQPYFTMTAANVAYGWWSHDLGGHTSEPGAELYLRWVQLGVFSPLFRTHSTKFGGNDRRFWTYPIQYSSIMMSFVRLRAQLVPYLAAAALDVYDTGLSLCLPLYYDYPESEESYPSPGGGEVSLSGTSYMFGPSMLVTPIVSAMDNVTALAYKDVWIPPGTWVGMFSGDVLTGPMNISLNASLSDMPVFVRAGDLIPLAPEVGLSDPTGSLLGAAQHLPRTLVVQAFVGGVTSGSLTLREDAGNDLGYQNQLLAITTASYTVSGANLTEVQVDLAQTQVFPGFLTQRSYDIRLRGVYPATSVIVDGALLSFEGYDALPGTTDAWSYDAATLELRVHLRTPRPTNGLQISVSLKLEGTVECGHLLSGLGFAGLVGRARAVKAYLDQLWLLDSQVYQDLYPNLIRMASAPSRINSALARSGGSDPQQPVWQQLQWFASTRQLACGEMAELKCRVQCETNLQTKMTAWLNCPDSTLDDDSSATRRRRSDDEFDEDLQLAR